MSRSQPKRIKLGSNVRPEVIVDGDDLEQLVAPVEEKSAPEAEVEEKNGDEAEYMPTFNATSFSDLDTVREEHKRTREAMRTTDDFQALISNIMWNNEITDKGKAIKELADEYIVRLQRLQHKEEHPDPVQFIKNLLGVREDMTDVPLGYGELPGTATISKDAKGNWRWLGVFTNNFIDTDGEILTAEAHKEFCGYLDQHPEYAPLSVSWHTLPTARKSRADFWDFTDEGFFVMGGPLTEEEAGILQKAQEMHTLGMSHGFFVLEKNGNLIKKYRTFEVSDLPVENAANKWTNFSAMMKEANMAFKPEKRAYLVNLYGEDHVKALEAGLKTAKEGLEAAGVQSKEQAPESEASVEEKTETVVEPQAEVKPPEEPQAEVPVEGKEDKPADGPETGGAPVVEQKSAEALLGELLARISNVEKQNADLKEQVAQANKSVEDRWAEAILPPVAKSIANISESNRASKSDETVVPEGDALTSAGPDNTWVQGVKIL